MGTILNKKARHNYNIEETYEAGLVLLGSEVKSIREGKVHLEESFARARGASLFLYGCSISPYPHSVDLDPIRVRKLLLHTREILKLSGKVKRSGFALIPLKIYFKGGWAKVELALARGKKLYDKRQAEAKKSAKREIDRARKARR